MFLLSSAYLFYVSEKNMDLDHEKNWWVLYFENPSSDSMTFIIENHSDTDNFHWEVFADKKMIRTGNEKINKGSTWTSNVQVGNLAGKVTVRVSSGSDKKEIYKNFNK